MAVISNGDIARWAVVMRVSDNAPGVFEGVGSSGKLLVRLDSDGTLVELTPAQTRMPTSAEIVTRDAAIELAAATAANTAAAARLTTAGGDPCP